MVALEAERLLLTDQIPFRVAHAMRGRVRIICSSREAGLQLARRFALHHDVRDVRFVVDARSLTITFDSEADFWEIYERLPDIRVLGVPVRIKATDGFELLRLSRLFFELLSGNPLALIDALFGSSGSSMALVG